MVVFGNLPCAGEWDVNVGTHVHVIRVIPSGNSSQNTSQQLWLTRKLYQIILKKDLIASESFVRHFCGKLHFTSMQI